MERRVKGFSKLTIVLFILFSLWILLQVIAPLALPPNSVRDLSGLVAVSDNDQIIKTMGFPWNVLYTSGDRLCHQKAERSLFINGNQMPFCTRCTAIWLGIALGLGFMVFYTIQLTQKFVVAIVLGLLPIGIDAIGQLFGFWESTNIIRFITGSLAGGVCGVAISIILDEIKDIRFLKRIKFLHKHKT